VLIQALLGWETTECPAACPELAEGSPAGGDVEFNKLERREQTPSGL